MENTFRQIYLDLQMKGRKVYPREHECIEIENYHVEFQPRERFANFTARKLNLQYIKREFLWYLKGDRFDDSITKHAKIWGQIQAQDGSFNSQYGQYIFGKENQFDKIVGILKADKDSRRASIIILKSENVSSETLDEPCTYAINFRIRNGKLNMSVHMRSQDAMYGLGNDIPTFSFIHEMILNALREFYPELEYGTYHHSVDSLHVYEKHFEMLNTIVRGDTFKEIHISAMCGSQEVKFIRALDFSNVPNEYAFTNWLIS